VHAQTAGVKNTGTLVPVCELLILLIYIVVRPADASTGVIATKMCNIAYLLILDIPVNISIK